MADRRLRELERAGSDPAARARLLLERVRAGELERDRLFLAAYVGDETARLAAPRGYATILAPERPEGAIFARWPAVDAKPFPDWIQGLTRWGPMASVRAALAGAWVALRAYADCGGTRLIPRSGVPWPAVCHCYRCFPAQRAIEAAEDWVLCPCERHREACMEAVGAIANGFMQDSQVCFAALALACGRADPTKLGGFERSLLEAARLTFEQAVRTALREELVPWALGERDPVAERAKARGGARG